MFPLFFTSVFVFLQMLDASQTLLPADELKKRFDQEGKNLDLFQVYISRCMPKSINSTNHNHKCLHCFA